MKRAIKISIIVILIIIIILLLILYIRTRNSSTQTTETRIVTTTNPTPEDVTLENSYVFASPLRAKTNGEAIRVYVFLLDSQGKGVFGKEVTLASSQEFKVSNVQATTDDTGRALFDIVGYKAGNYQIEAKVDGKVLPQKVEVVFD